MNSSALNLSHHERRRSFRVEPTHTSAICRTAWVVSRLDVEDISAGGARLRGRPGASVGDSVRLWLLTPAGSLTAIGGMVVRRERRAASDSIGVAFDALAADAEQALDGLLADQLTRLKRPLAVIAGVDRDQARVRRRRLHGEGYRTCAVITPLDLIHTLEVEADVAVVILGERLGGIGAAAIRSFMAHLRPELACVPLAESA